MHFLCDTIYRLPEVLGKSLKTVLDEVHFMVLLYSFSLTTIAQENPSFPQVSQFPLSHVEQVPKQVPSSPSFRNISKSVSVYLFLDFEP